MATVAEIMSAIAHQIDVQIGPAGGATDPMLVDLQVADRMNTNPTPPSIDVYPGDPFQEGVAYGKANNAMQFNVRARVTTADHYAGQNLLLALMDTASSTSLARALLSDDTLGGVVDDIQVLGPTSYGVYEDAGGNGRYLGCIWMVQVLP